jgi:hypothetical protein
MTLSNCRLSHYFSSILGLIGKKVEITSNSVRTIREMNRDCSDAVSHIASYLKHRAVSILWCIDLLLSSDCKNRSFLGNVSNIHVSKNKGTAICMWSASLLFLCNHEVHTPLQQYRMCFPGGSCEGVILKSKRL